MAFGTPNEHYDSKKASELLHSVGEQMVSVALSNLLKRGVISKLIRDPTKDGPGRRYKISEMCVLITKYGMRTTHCRIEIKQQ